MAELVMRAPREEGRELHYLSDDSPCLELCSHGRAEPCYVDADGSGYTDCGDHI
jgi:hypothetical protein